MRIILVVSLVFILSFLFFAGGVSKEAEEPNIKTFAKDLKKDIDDVRTLHADEIIDIIDKNLKKLLELDKELSDAENYSKEKAREVLNVVTESLKRMFITYNMIGSMRVIVTDDLKERITNIFEKTEQASEAISALFKKKKELETLMDEILNSKDIAEDEKEIRIKSLKTQVSFIGKRIELWQELRKAIEVSGKSANDMYRIVDRFFIVAEENAKIYYEAYKTWQLAKNISDISEVLETVNDLDEITNSLLKSWDTLENMLESLDKIMGKLMSYSGDSKVIYAGFFETIGDFFKTIWSHVKRSVLWLINKIKELFKKSTTTWKDVVKKANEMEEKFRKVIQKVQKVTDK